MQLKKITATLLPLILLISFLLVPTTYAQEEISVVQAVLFYSPTCPHCEHVIKTVLPPLMEQYGEQLQIIGVNTHSQEGQSLYQAAIDSFDIPAERQGVPTLIIGKTVLVGSNEIPSLLPDLIKEGIDSGGLAWPDIPGLEKAVADSRGQATEQVQINPTTEATVSTELDDPFPQERSMVVKFKRDVVGNSFSVVLLVGMIVSVIIIWGQLLQGKPPRFSWPEWVIPALSVVGIFVAVYLSYVEITQTKAVCGPVGDCNTVQQSPYATLFGFLPVGVLGLGGYIGIIAAWLIYQYGPDKWHFLSVQALWGMAFFGTLFSIYLTFLEPFVIGATCAWCLTSAFLMVLLLWITTNMLRHALEQDPELDLDYA